MCWLCDEDVKEKVLKPFAWRQPEYRYAFDDQQGVGNEALVFIVASF